MRPRELTLDGFRSYRGPTTFDWRDRRLVGIVGPIGAGKSSILDAVAFALYGKTPGVGRDTKSLIHQLCDEAHVALTFEVDGQIWKAVRAPKRKGQSGHQLLHLSADEPGAEALDTITQEGAVNAKVEQLLGMDFQTFCRSVLLAQNRFSDFLKATRTERDKVLKGVFGYERLDAAKTAAERRLDREELALASLARERQTIDEARTRLEDARERAELAAAESKALEAVAPEVERLTKERASAQADAAAAAAGIAAIEAIAGSLPAGERVDQVLQAAADARGVVAEAKADLERADQARAACDAELALVRERLGDREQLRSFERLVERHDELARSVERAGDGVEQAQATAIEARQMLEQRRNDAVEAAEALARADDLVQGSAATVAEAREALSVARHTEMAHELRAGLATGEPCPVCAQPVHALPKRGPAPKAVTAAEKSLTKAEATDAATRKDKERLATLVGSAETSVSEAEVRLTAATQAVEVAEADLRAAEAELTAMKDQLAERLGDGEPHQLVATLESELTLAEGAAGEAASAVEVARRRHEAERERAETVHAELALLANELAGVWGRLEAPRPLAPEPDVVRATFVEAGETVLERHRTISTAMDDARERDVSAMDGLTTILASVGLAAGDDFVAARAKATAAHAAAAAVIDELERQIARSSDLEREVLAAEARRTLARKLTDDLKPAKFLAFLLEEERAELAELGSGLFETLTGGSYRFAADDSFDILDLNAADRTRKADSLSGGETFLASLALALALAEMVARSGGRLDAFFLDEGFGSLDPDHLDRAMDGVGRLVAEDDRRLVVLVSHVAEMREALEDLIVLDKDDRTGDTIVVSGAAPA